MARKLKTFVTSVGFFDLAVAAPSMKAAMEAWGMTRNAFHQGFASETEDAQIIAGATAKPGVVLRRAVGTNEPFREDAELPKGFSLPALGQAIPSAKPKAKTKVRGKPKKAASETEEGTERAAVISFEKERAKRERVRAREKAAAKRAQSKHDQAVNHAQHELEEARKTHRARRAHLQREQEAIDQRLREEDGRWNKIRRDLESALEKARRS